MLVILPATVNIYLMKYSTSSANIYVIKSGHVVVEYNFGKYDIESWRYHQYTHQETKL